MDNDIMPNHIAIIMDGNRRWAKKRNLPIKLGHKQGAKTLEDIARHGNKIGLKYLTVYAFSTENWKRSEEEVNSLMFLLENYLKDYSKRADTENIRIKVLGDIEVLNQGLKDNIKKAVERTKNNTGITLCIALNYGGRDEIVKATRQIAKEVKENKINIEDITEETIDEHLYTNEVPDPDLLIRTSGELRLSGFLPWQSVYSEFLFLDKLWPDFTNKDLDDAIEVYKSRNRKFGAK